MNQLERYIYNLVRFSPKFKRNIVRIYQRALSVIPIKRISTKYEIVVREGFFFGFHDKSPWSSDNKYLLGHKINFDDRMPAENDKVEVGIFEGKNFEEFTPLDKTITWNWQMGSMLQWVGNTNNVIFNDFDGDKHISRVIDLSGKLIRVYQKPVAAVSPKGDYGLSHSFVRLRKTASAYGYANGFENSAEINCPENDGIYLIDLKTGESNLILSLARFQNMADYPANSYYYFTHCLFSPNGNRFAFYHRWLDKYGKTWTELFTSNLDGTDVFKFDFSGVVTHLAWKDEIHLLVYGLKKKYGDHYYLLKDQTQKFKIIGENYFTSDGHPQFSPNNNSIVTDSYPDRFRRQYLIHYDLDKKESNDIAVLRSPLKYSGDVRCDLHPRWDRTGKFISFDSAHTGKRALCTVKF